MTLVPVTPRHPLIGREVHAAAPADAERVPLGRVRGHDGSMDRWLEVVDVAVGLSLLVLASVMVAPTVMRVLLASVGVTWMLGTVVPALVASHRTALVVCLLAFPSGHLGGWVRGGLAAAGTVLALGVVPQVGVAGYFALVSCALLALRDRELVSAAAVAALVVGLTLATTWAVLTFDPASFNPWYHLLAYQAVVLAVGIVLVGATRFQPLRSRRLADRLLAGEVRGGVAGLASLLRVTLRDPDLTIALAGTASVEQPHLARVAVRDDGNIVALLHHRPGSIPDERSLGSVVEAIRLAALQEQRTLELDLQSRELEAAGHRLSEAAARRRANISSRLADAVLSRIDEAAIAVEAASARSVVPVAGAALTVVRDELRATKHDVRLVVENGRPQLGEGGLPAALRRLTTLSQAVSVEVAAGAVGDPSSETALYYAAAEAVTNALKHARAEAIVVRLVREGGDLVLSVADDGSGGADPRGTGLAGLMSRLEACGGALEITSPGGAGTTVTARVPVTRSSSSPR